MIVFEETSHKTVNAFAAKTNIILCNFYLPRDCRRKFDNLFYFRVLRNNNFKTTTTT